MLCEEESANSSHILKFQSQGNVIYYPVTQWWWLVWRKQVQRKKNSIELLERGKILPLYDYFDQKCRRADKIGTF